MWEKAKWIGSPRKGVHTGNLQHYRIELSGAVSAGNEAGFVFGARDRDNHILLSVDPVKGTAQFTEYTDEAWLGSHESGHGKRQNPLGNPDGYSFAPQAVPAAGNTPSEKNAAHSTGQVILAGQEDGVQKTDFALKLLVDRRKVWLWVNEEKAVDGEELIPDNPQNKPRKAELLMVGFRQEAGSAIYRNISVTAWDKSGAEIELLHVNKANGWRQFAALGELREDGLLVDRSFHLVNPVPAVTLAKEFELTKQDLEMLDSAVLAATARGFYVCYINGKRVGDSFFTPGFTEYSLHIDWQEEEVKALLQSGKNRIVAIVGKGYYTGFCGYSGAEVYGQENSFLGCLELNFRDGRREEVATDESWFYTDEGPVQYGEFQDGEYYDARLDGAQNAALDQDTVWEKCGLKTEPGEPTPINGTFDKPHHFYMKKQEYPAAKEVCRLNPIRVTESPKGHFVYDLGQNMVGTVRILLKGEGGQSFRFRYGEMCYGDGQVYVENLRTATSTDIYVCKGEGTEEFLPEFTAHGFRYVEVSGDGYELENADSIVKLEGIVLANVDRIMGDFTCSHTLLNRLQSNIQWGQRGNFLLIPTDCPQRNERMGWTGDIQVFAPTAVFNMDVQSFLRKWLLDLREAQILYNRDGAAPDTAPLGGDNRTDGCGGWGDAAVFVPWELYQEYNDITILSGSYDLMRDWVEYQSRPDRETKEGIQTKQRRGDHLAYDTATPHELCATAYAAHSAQLLSKAAAILGKEEDAKKYGARFERVKKAFCDKWFHADGTCEFPTQTAYALAIDFELLSREQRKGAGQGLLEAVRERDDHLSVGFLGISHLLPALSRTGNHETAAKLLLQEGCPGWLYSVINHATTIWERWNSYIAETHTFGDVNMNSFNHYAYGAVGEWMYREILGIRREAAGYDRLVLEPKPIQGLTYAKGYHICGHGRIESAWKLENGSFLYECTVPEGCETKVILPDGHTEELPGAGKFRYEVKLK